MANLNSSLLEGDTAASVNVAITSGAAGGHVDDAPFTAGTDDVSVSGGFFNDSTPDSIDEGDAGALRMSANRVGYRTLRDAAGNERGQNVSAQNAAAIEGDVAHDGPDLGNPVKQGGVAIAHGTNPTAVAAADRVDLLASRAGVPFVIAGHPNIVTTRTNFTAAQTDTALITIAGGLKIVVTRVSVLADNANTVDVQARIGFAAVNTPTGVGVVLTHPGIAAGSGVVEGTGAGILGVGADGEDLRITSEVPTTGSIDVVTSHYTIES